MPQPIIGVTACHREIQPHPYQVVQEKYIRAAGGAAGGIALLIPTLEAALDMPALLARIDGLMLTGSPSNVEPNRYGGEPSAPGTLHDPPRDHTVLTLVRRAVDSGVPLLALCRGIQELNVAYGGALHQRVHALPGMLDHREDKTLALAEQYAPAHDVALQPGGLLHALSGADNVRVNSLHSQGIARLGEGLFVEARAPDGLIEAVGIEAAHTFALGVQWHPEWQPADMPLSLAIFAAFGDACRARAAAREPYDLHRAVV